MHTLAKCFCICCIFSISALPVWGQQKPVRRGPQLGFPGRAVQFTDTLVPSATEEARSGLGDSTLSPLPSFGGQTVSPPTPKGQVTTQPGTPSRPGTLPADTSELPSTLPPPEQIPRSNAIVSEPSSSVPINAEVGAEDGGGPFVESSAESFLPDPGFTDATNVDPGLIVDAGSAYGLPMSDVIPEAATEVYSTNNWFRGGRWYSQHEGLMWLRTDLPKVHIALDRSITGGNDVFTLPELHSAQGDFRFQPGMRMSVGRIFGRDVANRDHGIELSFTGLFEFDGHAAIAAADLSVIRGIDSLLGSLEVDTNFSQTRGFPQVVPVDGFSDASSQEFFYSADLNSLEFNYTVGGRPVRDRLVMQPDGRWVRFGTPSNVRALFAGVRYLRQNELFEYKSFGGIDDASVTSGNPVRVNESGTYRVATDNNLTGIQLGADLTEKHTDWMAGMRFKVGGLANFADRKSSVRAVKIDIVGNQQQARNIARDQTLDDRNLTFLAETGLYFAYFLRPNTSIRCGYDLLYMNGLATATNNIGLHPNFPVFEMTGDAFYHGLSVGLEAAW